MATVKISPKDFKEKVNQGWKREELMQHYGIKSSDVTSILKQLGLTIRKFHKPRFELVDEEEGEIQHTVTATDVANNPDAGLAEGETVGIKEEVSPPVEEKKKRVRQTKEKVAPVTEEVEVQEDTQPETTQEVAVQTPANTTATVDSPFGQANVVAATEETIDVMKATEDVQTSFNIPNGAGTASNVGSEDAFNSQPVDSATQAENPFLKAWGK